MLHSFHGSAQNNQFTLIIYGCIVRCYKFNCSFICCPTSFLLQTSLNDKIQTLFDRWWSPNKNTPVENQTQRPNGLSTANSTAWRIQHEVEMLRKRNIKSNYMMLTEIMNSLQGVYFHQLHQGGRRASGKTLNTPALLMSQHKENHKHVFTAIMFPR